MFHALNHCCQLSGEGGIIAHVTASSFSGRGSPLSLLLLDRVLPSA